MVLQTILFVLAALLLGAHFLREGNLLILLLCILAPFLLLHKKRWVLMALQASAWVASAIWIYTAVALVQQRMAMGKPFRGVILILGSVTLLTIVAGLFLNARGMKDRYPG